jgi:hypothetical protein
VLTKRSLNEIADDEGSDEWQSNRKAAVKKGAEWLQGSVDRVSRKPTLSAKNAERVGHPRNSSSTARKKTSVKKKTRKAA